MDRREFHRIAHQSDDVARVSMEGSTPRWRPGDFQSRMAATPHGFIVEPSVQPLRGYPIHRVSSLHPDNLFNRVPGFGNGSGSYGEATRQTALPNLVHVVRRSEHRIPMRQAKLMTSAFPTGYCAHNPPRTRAYVGLIAPSLVGRPVIQFRRNNDRSKRSEFPIVDLLDDASTESSSRRNPETDYQKVPPVSSPSTAWQQEMQEVCFTSNGMMQMDLIPDRLERPTIEEAVPKDLRLCSLGIAQCIGTKTFTCEREQPCEKSIAPSEVINVISDDDEEKDEDVCESVEVEDGRIETSQSTQSEVMERLQPLLNAIEMLSSHDVSEEDASTTSRNGNGMKSGWTNQRRGMRSLNDISQEICKTPRKREDAKLDEQRNGKTDRTKRKKEEDNPYRKFYTKRRQRTDGDALWRFLFRGISQEIPTSPVIVPTETVHAPPQIPLDVCQAEEGQRQKWLRQLKIGDVQLLVEQYGLCGLAEILQPDEKT